MNTLARFGHCVLQQLDSSTEWDADMIDFIVREAYALDLAHDSPFTLTKPPSTVDPLPLGAVIQSSDGYKLVKCTTGPPAIWTDGDLQFTDQDMDAMLFWEGGLIL